MKKLKIAQLSTPFISVPPLNYGGTELVVYNITEGLVKKGHQVTLFAPGDSKTSAQLISPFPKALFYERMQELFSPTAFNLFWLHSLPTIYHGVFPFEQAKNFDIIHNHLHYIGLFFSQLVKTPTIHTYHGDFASAIKSPIEKMILEKYKDCYWIAISESQKRNCSIKLNFVGIVHHGIPIEKFTFNEKPKDNYLAWLGRITPKKGIETAIKIAKTLKIPLKIAGIVHERDKEFFKTKIKPQIDNKLISFFGGPNLQEKVKFLSQAKTLLYPVTWEEPFGLVMIESMACGTPVVAFARGSVPEVIKDGETGFIVNPSDDDIRGNWIIKKTGIEGLCEAVERIYSMPEDQYRKMRRACREHVEKNFTVERMVDEYEKVYEEILNKH